MNANNETTAGALTWQVLFPADSSYVPLALPEEYRELLARTSGESPSRVLVTSDWRLASGGSLEGFAGVVGINARGMSPRTLRAAGFAYVRRFAAVPNLREARWYMPLDTRQVAAAGFALYAPLKVSARLKRLAAIVGARTGMPFWYGDEVIVARRTLPAIESRINELHPDTWARLTLLTGTPGPARKPTIAALGAEGRPLVIAKVAVSSVGERLIRHEARMLTALSAMPVTTSGNSPKLLHEGLLDGSHAIIESALAGSPAGTPMGPAHAQFLDSMRYGERRPLGESAFVRSLQPRHLALREWSAAVYGALNWLIPRLKDVEQPPCVIHGDFVPWNLRELHGNIAAFDWEYAELDGIPLVDEAHYLLHMGYLTQGWTAAQSYERVMKFCATTRATATTSNQTLAIVMAYVVDVLLRRREEGLLEGDPLSTRYEELLARLGASESSGLP